MDLGSCHWPNLTCFCFEMMERNRIQYTISEGKFKCTLCDFETGKNSHGIGIHYGRKHPDAEKPKKPKRLKHIKKDKWKAKVKHGFKIDDKLSALKKILQLGGSQCMQIKQDYQRYLTTLQGRNDDLTYPDMLKVKYDFDLVFRHF